MIKAIKQLLGLPTFDIQAMKQRGAAILDVRTPTEFQRWHINGAVNIDYRNVGKCIRQIRRLSGPVITCCRSNWRSDIATRILRGLGVEAYNGGNCRELAKEWQTDKKEKMEVTA